MRNAIRAAIALLALVLALELRIDRAAAATRSSPNGLYVATNGKATDGYHDTIWLRDTKTGVTIDLLAPDDEKPPGAAGNGIVNWLDNDWLAFMHGWGTGSIGLMLVNIHTHELRYFCTDGMFYLSPDKKHAAGQGDGPYKSYP